MRIKHIVIIGGGTAGWVTAHNFLNQIPPDIQVSVVATKEIPIVGVGESTTGLFNYLINLKNNITGLDEKEFLKETQSTFKLGIKHSDWHTLGKSFYSPLGDNYYSHQAYPHSTYDHYRIYHVANELEYNETLQARLMATNRLHYKYNKNISPILLAYHLDTYKVGSYLKRKALAVKNCRYIDDQVVTFKQDEKGYVKSIQTKTGKTIYGDLFVDCSGFARILIDKAFKNKFISYADNLLVNSALTFNIKNKGGAPVKNYTHAWAQKYGWLWQIPTQERMGCGYVYSDHFINATQAQKEIESLLGHKIKPQKKIKFHTGRLEKFWIKNVLSTGLSSAFIEPLEATSIHATLMQINHFLQNYFKPDLSMECELFSQQYNSELTQMWDKIRDFIVFHYITPRKDTQFWTQASSEKRQSEKLKNLLHMWKYRMPRTVDYVHDIGNNFYTLGNNLWYQIAIGMKLLSPKVAKKELKDYNLYDMTTQDYLNLKKTVENVLDNHVTTNNYYDGL